MGKSKTKSAFKKRACTTSSVTFTESSYFISENLHRDFQIIEELIEYCLVFVRYHLPQYWELVATYVEACRVKQRVLL